jgi:hypothetical protein
MTTPNPNFSPANGYHVSDEVDFVAGGTGIVLFPARPGLFYLPITVLMIVTQAAGVLVQGFLLKAGNNVNRDNVMSQTAVSSWLTQQQTAVTTEVGTPLRASPGVIYSAGGHPAAGGPMADMASPILLDITTPASGTGGFVLKAKIVMAGVLVNIN